MKALVIGMGVSGQSAARFLQKKGYDVCGVDRKPPLIDGITLFSEADSVDAASFDLVVVSPGVSPNHPLYTAARQKGVEIVGEAELACREMTSPFFAITGTNGKTSVTEMVAHILNFAGIKARSLGNVGTPLTSVIEDVKDCVVVAELSSYQLETLKSKVIDAAVILNITPDHLDRYSSFEDYAKAKIGIKNCLKPDGNLYVYKKVYEDFRYLFGGFVPKIYGYSSDCDYFYEKNRIFNKKNIECLMSIRYRSVFSHDIENIMAAYALCKEVGIGPEVFLKALSTFKKPPHRIEFVRQKNGVRYFNDSKGTNIDAVIKAVNSMEKGVILIAGGVDKQSSYDPWIEAFADKVKCICTIGEASEKIEKELSSKYKVERFKDLESAVTFASKEASQEDSVLLSPGCASFDMFKDYLHRGEEFIRIVNKVIDNV